MSKSRAKKHPKTLSEQRTLPIQAPDVRDPQTRAAQQSDANVQRIKNWGEDHET